MPGAPLKETIIFKSLIIINNDILNSEFANDNAIIDDTAMTNMYGQPFEEEVLVNPENHTQLFRYSIIPNKSFELFGKDYI